MYSPRQVLAARHWVRIAVLLCAWRPFIATAADPAVTVRNGRLQYARSERGDRIPDFSVCGFASGESEPPNVAVRAVVEPTAGDDGARVQAAIDAVAARLPDEKGYRGTVFLAPGTFEIEGQLRLRASGVVLRGCGVGPGGTTIVATGRSRRTAVRIFGAGDRQMGEPRRVASEYIAVGESAIALDSAEGLRVGDRVLVTRPSTSEWIAALGADVFGVGWRPGSRDLHWDRTIQRVNGSTVELDAPLTTALDVRYGGGSLAPYEWPRRITNVGVEDLAIVSQFAQSNPCDEEHAWFGVTLDDVEDAWVRRVEFRNFAGGAVAAWEGASRVTVADCTSLAPISENAGYRRHAFVTMGQRCLFLRCWSERGRHDFAVGDCAPGPNAFVNCRSYHSLGDSGPLESWASGVLYDNVRIDGGGLALENRWSSPVGAGWAAANSVLWQCQASTIRVFQPPTAQNWAVGVWGVFAGDGQIENRSEFAEPPSLYQTQLHERFGAAADARVEPLGGEMDGATNPTLEQAAEFAAQSSRPASPLLSAIRRRQQEAQQERLQQWNEESGDAAQADSSASAEQPTIGPDRRRTLKVTNGWLTINGSLAVGKHYSPRWWSGNARPGEASSFGPAITRFVPGREGVGLTDDLAETADWMQSRGVAALEHHHGLWYDRRRDDHLMVRRADAACYPPFYEQPFARTGRGTAWDGLSRYDLTRFNPWYWDRLREFAELCDQRGLTLMHQHYFQHNILEAGAHWADSPWRPVNNVNRTGLPEPPLYIGDKRVFMAPIFYDVADDRRRELHRNYMHQCLSNFAGATNVIHLTSAEYSGPLSFTQFWLDTITRWREENASEFVVGLSAPKDVQDAILTDPLRSNAVDLIDIRYWAYTADGSLYAPRGGLNLAPRQHLRQTRQKPGGFAAIVHAVREYRTTYPEKAVTYFADLHCPSTRDGWAVLMGGGSLADVRLPAGLASSIVDMRPADGVVEADQAWSLASDAGQTLVYSLAALGSEVQVRPPRGTSARYKVTWIDTHTGVETPGGSFAGPTIRVKLQSPAMWLVPETP